MKKAQCTKAFASMLIVFSLSLSFSQAEAFAVKQSDLDWIEQQLETLSIQREESQAKVDELQNRQASVLEQKAALDERNQYTQKQIDLINEQLALMEDLVKQKEEDVKAAAAKEEEQLERYRMRVRAMEENSGQSILDIIVSSSNFSQALAAVDDMGAIMESDRELQEEYLAAREETQKAKAELEEAMEAMEARRREFRLEKTRLEQEVREAYELIAGLQNDIDRAVEEYEINAAAEDEMIAYFDELSKQFAQEQEEALRSALANGTFIWPVPDCTLLTSRFGYRMHPILGYERFHAGVDIGAKAGDTIIASDGGTVAVAEYSDSYGNYVLINHGNGYTTLYAHMSSMAVEAGQAVEQGDTLGYVGSTGWSTGPHLHFEIRYNDEKTDPEAYFTGLSYYNC